jgi:hypothetical protein
LSDRQGVLGIAKQQHQQDLCELQPQQQQQDDTSTSQKKMKAGFVPPAHLGRTVQTICKPVWWFLEVVAAKGAKDGLLFGIGHAGLLGNWCLAWDSAGGANVRLPKISTT